MPAGDVFGLDGFFLNKSNPVIVSTIGINSTGSSAGIAVTGGSFNAGNFTLNLSNTAGLSTTPFYTGAKIAVSNVGNGYNGTFVVTGFAGTTTVSYATSSYVGTVTTPLSGLTGTLALLVTDTQVTNTTWSSAQTHGWFGGGQAPSVSATVDRIDFSNDSSTASPRGPLSLARYWLASTGNSNYGWFGGGYAPTTNRTTVDRIDFSNDSASASPRGSLSLARNSLSATGNSNYGWFGGGFVFPSSASTVDRIDFSNDSATASPRGPLSLARRGLAATGNSNYGWFGGGGTPGAVSTVDRIDFSNDSATASPRGPLSSVRIFLSATGNSNYGWFGGGHPSVATVDRIDFSNDLATASPRGPLSAARGYLAATGNSNYGWFGGGSGLLSTVDRIDFSNDSSTASVRGPLSLGRNVFGATSGQARSSSTRLQKAGNYGWFGGGIYQFPGFSTTYLSSIERIDFSNDLAQASTRGSFLQNITVMGATGNSNYGWFGGGLVYTNNTAPSPSNRVSKVDRIDFSNDSYTASPRGPLSLARSSLAATGNSNYGWFGGGFVFPSSASTVDRIDFSNDSATASPRGPLSLARNLPAATGNSNYGWFGGGYAPTPAVVSTVDRIDFSNDLATASPRGPLSAARYGSAATGNSNYGWFGGGAFVFPSPYTSTVDRIDFSNDSSMASPRGPLSLARNSPAATGNSNYGWFGGGRNTPSPIITVTSTDRINFANDSSTASPRGPLSAGRYRYTATSNTPT